MCLSVNYWECKPDKDDWGGEGEVVGDIENDINVKEVRWSWAVFYIKYDENNL